MSPFLELPMVLTNNEEKSKEVIKRVQPSEISDYYPGFYDGTVVVMKYGASWLCTLSAEEIDAALSAYHTTVTANKGKFGNLKLTPKKPAILHATD